MNNYKHGTMLILPEILVTTKYMLLICIVISHSEEDYSDSERHGRI